MISISYWISVVCSSDSWFGVLDHRVRLASGGEIEVTMRMPGNGDGAEVTLTLFLRPATSDDSFGRDAEWVGRDLDALKALVEGLPASAGARPSGRDRCIDYVELGVADIGRSTAFYGGAFGWRFPDYCPEDCEFSDGRLKSGLPTLAAPRPAGPPAGPCGDDHACA